MAFPSDYTIVGLVLAVAVAILLLTGLALYVAFRLRETLRDEKGGRSRTVKVAFLIGLLFLSGGVFYFFASGFGASGGNSSTLGTSSTTTGPASSTHTSTAQAVSMPTASCPSRAMAGSTFTCYVTIYDQGSTTYGSATLLSSGDFLKFKILGCTESVNGSPSTFVPSSSNSVALGNISPGTTILTVSVQAPSQSGQNNNNVLTLNAPLLTQPISVTFTIQVNA